MEGKKGSFGGMKKISSAWAPKTTASNSAPKVAYKEKEERKVVEEEKKTIKLPLDCFAEYTRDFIPAEKRKELYEALLKKVPWENKGMKRDTALFGDDGIAYNYGKGYDDEQVPKSWKEVPELLEIRDMIEKATNAKFDICLCGWYSNGSKSIGFHCDREELGKKTPIASISLGADRIFQFRKKGEQEIAYELTLHDGSLLVMGEFCQDRYFHSLPPDKNVKNGRINLTFRNSHKGDSLDEKMSKITISD